MANPGAKAHPLLFPVDSFLQLNARGEFGDLPGCNLDNPSGLRIASVPRFPL